MKRIRFSTVPIRISIRCYFVVNNLYFVDTPKQYTYLDGHLWLPHEPIEVDRRPGFINLSIILVKLLS